jgi:methionyl-tRNA synthetase
MYNAVMPKSSHMLWLAIGAEPALGPLGEQSIAQVGRWGQLPPGSVTTKTPPLFPRLPEEEE